MKFQISRNIVGSFSLVLLGLFSIPYLSSCGKQASASATGLNVQYQIINLSPDLFPVNLFIDFTKRNTTPFTFNVNQGYFYTQSLDTPYQIRSNLLAGTTFLNRDDTLKSGLKYTLYLLGTLSDNSFTSLFTIDTGSAPGIGRGKVRFVNVSPSATTAAPLDLYANGTVAFTKSVFKSVSRFIELPNGNYDFQIEPTGGTTVLKDLPAITIQDGKLYTIYAYGYTNRVDSAAFSAAVTTNK